MSDIERRPGSEPEDWRTRGNGMEHVPDYFGDPEAQRAADRMRNGADIAAAALRGMDQFDVEAERLTRRKPYLTPEAVRIMKKYEDCASSVLVTYMIGGSHGHR